MPTSSPRTVISRGRLRKVSAGRETVRTNFPSRQSLRELAQADRPISPLSQCRANSVPKDRLHRPWPVFQIQWQVESSCCTQPGTPAQSGTASPHSSRGCTRDHRPNRSSVPYFLHDPESSRLQAFRFSICNMGITAQCENYMRLVGIC